MASILREMEAHCHKCGDESIFRFDLAYVDYWGITPCYVCTRCNTIVPEFTWSKYQETGRIAIPV